MRQNRIQHLSLTNFHKLSGDSANGHIVWIIFIFDSGDFSRTLWPFLPGLTIIQPVQNLRVLFGRSNRNWDLASSLPLHCKYSTASALKRVIYLFLTESRLPAKYIRYLSNSAISVGIPCQLASNFWSMWGIISTSTNGGLNCGVTRALCLSLFQNC